MLYVLQSVPCVLGQSYNPKYYEHTMYKWFNCPRNAYLIVSIGLSLDKKLLNSSVIEK